VGDIAVREIARLIGSSILDGRASFLLHWRAQGSGSSIGRQGVVGHLVFVLSSYQLL
jgi:hypothetical protein